MARDVRKLYVVRDPDGDHESKEFADVYLGDQPIGGIFGTPEQLALVVSVFNSYNQTLDEASSTKES